MIKCPYCKYEIKKDIVLTLNAQGSDVTVFNWHDSTVEDKTVYACPECGGIFFNPNKKG